MKKLFFALTLFLAFNAQAGSVTITSNGENPDPKMAALASVPQELLGILTDQGLSLKNIGGGKFALQAQNINCGTSYRNAVDGPTGGIPTETCRINSEDQLGTMKGQILHDGRALSEQLNKIENAEIGGYYSDCAMGKCQAFVKSIRCVVDTKIDEFMKGRFSCTLVDDAQP